MVNIQMLAIKAPVPDRHSAETVLRASTELNTAGHLTRQTADMIDRSLPFDNNVLYALLHEASYCQGYGIPVNAVLEASIHVFHTCHLY